MKLDGKDPSVLLFSGKISEKKFVEKIWQLAIKEKKRDLEGGKKTGCLPMFFLCGI